MPPVPHAGASPCEPREWFRLVARKPPMLLLNPRCCTCRTRVCDECGSSRKQQCESTLHMREPHRNASVPRVCGIPTVGRLSELWCVAVGQKQNTHARYHRRGVRGSKSTSLFRVLVQFWSGSGSVLIQNLAAGPPLPSLFAALAPSWHCKKSPPHSRAAIQRANGTRHNSMRGSTDNDRNLNFEACPRPNEIFHQSGRQTIACTIVD